jgi:hypothetical protein
MSNHLTEREIDLYRRRQMDLAGRRRTEEHLAVCKACVKQIVTSEQNVLAFNAVTEAFLPSVDEEPFHLSAAEIERYVTGMVPEADRVICESHIEICNQCSEALRLQTAAYQTQEAYPKQPFGWPWPAWASSKTTRVVVSLALIGFLTIAILLWRQRSLISNRDESASAGSQQSSGSSLPPNEGTSSHPSNETPSERAGGADASRRSALVSLRDNNREIRLDQEGNLAGLEGFDESSQRIVKTALAGESLTKPKVLDELSPPPIKLLGEQNSAISFHLLSPSGKVVSEARPTLRWTELIGATNYVVSVFDWNFNQVAQSPSLSKSNWTLSAPLRRGNSYSWQVRAIKDGQEITAPVPPAQRAQFKVLEADRLKALTRLKQERPVSHLVLGLTYARFGLVDDAEGEFRNLLKENPDSAVVKKLLSTVGAWRSR